MQQIETASARELSAALVKNVSKKVTWRGVLRFYRHIRIGIAGIALLGGLFGGLSFNGFSWPWSDPPEVIAVGQWAGQSGREAVRFQTTGAGCVFGSPSTGPLPVNHCDVDLMVKNDSAENLVVNGDEQEAISGDESLSAYGVAMSQDPDALRLDLPSMEDAEQFAIVPAGGEAQVTVFFEVPPYQKPQRFLLDLAGSYELPVTF